MKNNKVLLLIIHTFLFISTLIVLIYLLFYKKGFRFLRFYTACINLFTGIVSLIFIVDLLIDNNISKFTFKLRYLSACGMLFTIIVVALVGAPNYNHYYDAFIRWNLFFHLINPILSSMSFIFLENYYIINVRDLLLTLIPTLVYMLFYGLSVFYFHYFKDFYRVALGGRYYITPVLGIIALISYFHMGLVVNSLNNKSYIRYIIIE